MPLQVKKMSDVRDEKQIETTRLSCGSREEVRAFLGIIGDYYVHLLRRPDGRPFYVGKGSGARVFDHEYEARHRTHTAPTHTVIPPLVAARISGIRPPHGQRLLRGDYRRRMPLCDQNGVTADTVK
jgi:hypothetical protein